MRGRRSRSCGGPGRASLAHQSERLAMRWEVVGDVEVDVRGVRDLFAVEVRLVLFLDVGLGAALDVRGDVLHQLGVLVIVVDVVGDVPTVGPIPVEDDVEVAEVVARTAVHPRFHHLLGIAVMPQTARHPEPVATADFDAGLPNLGDPRVRDVGVRLVVNVGPAPKDVDFRDGVGASLAADADELHRRRSLLAAWSTDRSNRRMNWRMAAISIASGSPVETTVSPCDMASAAMWTCDLARST